MRKGVYPTDVSDRHPRMVVVMVEGRAGEVGEVNLQYRSEFAASDKNVRF